MSFEQTKRDADRTMVLVIVVLVLVTIAATCFGLGVYAAVHFAAKFW